MRGGNTREKRTRRQKKTTDEIENLEKRKGEKDNTESRKRRLCKVNEKNR
jgi:hypothetical protein